MPPDETAQTVEPVTPELPTPAATAQAAPESYSVTSDTPQAAQADGSASPADAQTVTTGSSAQPVESPPAQPAETKPPEEPATAAEEPATAAEDAVPLARLKGVQRQLSAVEKDRDSYKAMTAVLQEQLAAAEKRAASEFAERIRATHRDIVPSLIRGETVEQVEQALANSKAAFAAAQQAYARQIPTPQVGTAAPQATAQPKSPLQLIRDGLTQPKQDINS